MARRTNHLIVKAAIGLGMGVAGTAAAQWTNIAPNHIGNTNAGSVGVGISSNAFMFGKLSVMGDGAGSSAVWARSLVSGGAGVYAENHQTGGTGVFGIAGQNTTGQAIGVWGVSLSPNGVGVVGQTNSPTGFTIGVYGQSTSPSGYAGYFAGGRNYFQGNVGIGTTTPAVPLHVIGNINTTGMRTASTASGVNVLGGIAGNSAASGVHGATIAGGGATGAVIPEVGANNNSVFDHAGTVGGGYANRAGENDGNASEQRGATVAGGVNNWARGAFSFVGGGNNNTAGGLYSAIVGGFNNSTIIGQDYAIIMGGNGNTAGSFAMVGGGQTNAATGQFSVIPGGSLNTAAGVNSFAAGSQARALHNRSFVWNGHTIQVETSGIGQFVVNAPGGIFLGSTSAGTVTIGANDFIATGTGATLSTGGVWTNASDAALKEGFRPVDPADVLARLDTLPITRWKYRTESEGVEHIGPTAQDFFRAFGVGDSERTIGTVDASGVAMAAIQGLHALVKAQRTEIERLRADRDALEARLQRLEQLLAER